MSLINNMHIPKLLKLSVALSVFSGCGQVLDEQKVFNYPVSVVQMPSLSGSLSPKLFSEYDYPSGDFHMIGDSVMFSMFPSSTTQYFFALVDINNADTLVQVCHMGRGFDEMLLPCASFEVIDGYAHLVDFMTATYYKLNLTESMIQGRTIVDEKIKLDYEAILSPYYVTAIQNRLICFNSRVNINENSNLGGVPCFTVFDLSDGRCIDEYRCFGEVPLEQKSNMKSSVQSTLYCYYTSNWETGTLFFANWRVPQINYLDCNTGSVRGIRFGKDMRLSLKKPYQCFEGVCAGADKIFALFSGSEVGNSDSNCNKLFVFDWEGNVHGLFQLDGPYFNCVFAGDKLFLARSDKEDKLYYLPLDDILSAHCETPE